jgi:hypothetical protein
MMTEGVSLRRPVDLPPLVASNSVMKPEYREGELYERARDAYYFEANY